MDFEKMFERASNDTSPDIGEGRMPESFNLVNDLVAKAKSKGFIDVFDNPDGVRLVTPYRKLSEAIFGKKFHQAAFVFGKDQAQQQEYFECATQFIVLVSNTLNAKATELQTKRAAWDAVHGHHRG